MRRMGPVAMIERAARKYPGRRAVITHDSYLTYAGLWTRSEAVMFAVRSQAPPPSARVAVCLSNEIDLVVTHVGILRAGHSTFLIDPSLGSERQSALVERSGAMFLTSDASPTPDRDHPSNLGPHDQSYLPERPAVMFHTAGTTGEPKLVEHSCGGLVESQILLQAGFADFLNGGSQALKRVVWFVLNRPRGLMRAALGRKVWASTLPLHRVAGHSLMLQALLRGETTVCASGLNSSVLSGLLRQERATVVAMSPLTAEWLLRTEIGSRNRYPHLLVMGLGSDRPAPDLADRLEGRFGCPVSVGYGSTELAGGVMATSVYGSRSASGGSVGLPFRNVAVRIVSADGDLLDAGSAGELQVRPPSGLQGSLVGRDSQFGSAASVGEESAAAWFSTGDEAWIDEKGQVHVLGRIDDLIIRGAYKVDPVEIESALQAHTLVRRAGVVAVPNSRGISRIVAFCETNDSADTEGLDLRAHCRNMLAGYQIPDTVILVDDLPLTPDGKIRRADLRVAANRQLTKDSSPSSGAH
jgi:acyl-CoA synthetase (AMP-forming)/AMP-acid ligase II